MSESSDKGSRVRKECSARITSTNLSQVPTNRTGRWRNGRPFFAGACCGPGQASIDEPAASSISPCSVASTGPTELKPHVQGALKRPHKDEIKEILLQVAVYPACRRG